MKTKRIKMKSMRCMAVLMALVVLTLNIQVHTVQAGPVELMLLTEEFLSFFGAASIAGGLNFGNEENTQKIAQEMANANAGLIQNIEDIRLQSEKIVTDLPLNAFKVTAMQLGEVWLNIMQWMNTYSNVIIDNESGAVNWGGSEVSDIAYYWNSYPVVKLPANFPLDTGGLVKIDIFEEHYQKYIALFNGVCGTSVNYSGKNAIIVDNMVYINGVLKTKIGKGDYIPCQFVFVDKGNGKVDLRTCGVVNSIRDGEVAYREITIAWIETNIVVQEVDKAYPSATNAYAATLSPTNIISDYPAAVAQATNLGNVTTDDEPMALVIPNSFVSERPETVVKPITEVITTPSTDPDNKDDDDDDEKPGIIIPPIGEPGDDTEEVGVLDKILSTLTSIKNTQTATQTDVQELPESIATTLVGEGNIDYSGTQNTVIDLTTVFPFCIPFDFARAIGSLYVTPKTPVFTINFSGTIFGSYVWMLDMTDFESIAQVIRWCVWIGFFVGLMVATHKFIKW